MPICDKCGKDKDAEGGVMTYKHKGELTGFTCGECLAEEDFDREAGKAGQRRLSTLMEEESGEREYEREALQKCT